MPRSTLTLAILFLFAPAPEPAGAGDPALAQAANTWVKRSPLPDGPPSPTLGYEGDCRWDPVRQRLIRYGGHNQGGGGEQNSELWILDPVTARWTLREPNLSPPGVCCAQQNVFDPVRGRYVRFPSFSGSHGWQWFREIYLNDSSVWTYDPEENRWRNLRPVPSPSVRPLRCASWDSHREVIVVFGGEGSREGTLVYDPYTNEWTRKRPPEEPPFRSGGNMAYDEARHRHVLFGAQFSDDPRVWAYDLARNKWTDMKSPALPPTDRNDAVLAYDSVHHVIIAVVKITEGEGEGATHRLETWAYDLGENTWRAMKPPREPDPSGNRARQLTFAPALNVMILENRTQRPREQQIWTYRYAAAPEDASPGAPVPARARQRERPPIVEDVRVSVRSPRRVEVTWEAPRGVAGETVGFHVERAPVEVLSDDQLERLKSKVAPLDPPSVGAVTRIGAFMRLTGEPLTTRSFVDTKIDLDRPVATIEEPLEERRFHPDQLDGDGRGYGRGVFAYRVRAVDGRGATSGPSPAMLTIPAPPEHLFAKEDGESCRLKWDASPDDSISGYRVYRLDGRWDSDSITRLTPKPIRATEFTDTGAGNRTRRYCVVTVDAIGQEGSPSSPVWHRREWRAYYEPFAGEWHQ